jgi:hypothetical protein
MPVRWPTLASARRTVRSRRHTETGRENDMKITYFVSAGRASTPLHVVANGSVEAGQVTSIVLGGDATEVPVSAGR